jgi:asparagine synthase (glutamine-hydrolysing)
MCGIWAYISKERKDYYEYFKKISHRGPDLSNYLKIDDAYIGFHRLSIMENNLNATQPYFTENILLICNGEIYNYKELINNYNLDIHNNADCLTILHLYKTLGYDKFKEVISKELIAEFAFIIVELENNKISKIIAARDCFGVRPLYYSFYDNNIIFSSELKGIPKEINDVKEFPCGYICNYDYKNKSYVFDCCNNDIYDTQQDEFKNENNEENKYLENIKNSLIEAVKKRLVTDDNIEIGYYLSGGLDSSIICSIASKLVYPKRIRTFSIGFKESTDLPYAKRVAEFINSEHTEIIITEQDALNAIDDVIYTTCTYDTTTIRASCGQYLISKYIKENTNIKVIINGDGSDEVLGGYMFNYYAPNSIDFDKSCKKITKEIHLYDSRRLDRCLAYFSLEARVPFLDIDFVKNYWKIPANIRMPTYKNCEKYLLRKAFDDGTYLDNECLYRTKEAFSDGISSKKKSWYSTIEEIMKDEEINDAPTKESSYYKKKFIEYFGENRVSILNHYWQPDFINNSSSYIDPSARVLDIYVK